MSPKDEQRVIDAVCAALANRSLMTKELVVALATMSISIKAKELNQLLYGRMRGLVGLSVKDFVWSFGSSAESTPSEPASTGPKGMRSSRATKSSSAAVSSTSTRTARAEMSTRAASPDALTAPPPAAPVRTLDFAPDPDQLAVINEGASARVFVEAGPGTGKTAVACRRIARLILEDDVNPANILVISFTRTAVAEIRSRIGHYVTRGRALQVQVSTIDSSAWQLEAVFGAGAREPDLKGFDETIESALSLIRKKDASLKDLLETLEHVVVDEAQDVTGIRSDFVIELVRALPKRCGVTIFADPMQSIYGFTLSPSADEPIADEAVEIEHPVDKLKASLPTFEQMRLRRTHRFSVELDGVLAKARAVVENLDLEGVEKQRQLGDGIKDAAERLPDSYQKIAELVRNDPNTLLLFRYRRDVVQASSFLSSSGVPHRMRMPQLPECIQPWMARVFWDYTATAIDEPRFRALFLERCDPVLPHDMHVDAAWESLRRLAPEQKGGVKMSKLRSVLARPRPPIDACYLDSGHTGPTLGTIHASKGREAESVYLFVPALVTKGDVAEESRVLYVAATRARTRLLAIDAFRADGKRLNKKGRCFTIESGRKGKMGKMEVGLAGDVHPVMSVSNRLCPEVQDASAAQDVLWRLRNELAQLRAKRTDRGREYRLSLAGEGAEEQYSLGALSARVFEDAKTIAKGVSKSALPAWELRFLFLGGARTHVVSADESGELEHAHEPYRTTGFFLVPHVRGYCRFYINNVGK